MTLVVVDASVVVKWFIPEVLDQEAQRLRGSEYTCIAPAHWRTEVLNALWKKLAVRHEIEAPEYEATVGFALATRMRSVPADELLPKHP